jgi:hypothetical protein
MIWLRNGARKHVASAQSSVFTKTHLGFESTKWWQFICGKFYTL